MELLGQITSTHLLAWHVHHQTCRRSHLPRPLSVCRPPSKTQWSRIILPASASSSPLVLERSPDYIFLTSVPTSRTVWKKLANGAARPSGTAFRYNKCRVSAQSESCLQNPYSANGQFSGDCGYLSVSCDLPATRKHRKII